MIASTPVHWNGSVYATNASRDGGALYRVSIDPAKASAKKTWSLDLQVGHGGTVCVGKRIYLASGGGKARGWVAVDADTGAVSPLGIDLTAGSLIAAEGRLYCLAEDGVLALLEPGPAGCKEVGRFALVKEKKKDVWAHPVISHGLLWLRYHDTLYCYDIRRAT